MKSIIQSFIIFSFLFAQGETADTTIDTAQTASDTFQDLGLEFGYKGYQWGQSSTNPPSFDNFSEPVTSSDQSSISMRGILGLDTVDVSFHYSDSGFWKVEFSFKIDESDIDAQMDKFLRIEKDISEVYGNPASIDHSNNGPSNSHKDQLNIKYSRAFYCSTWNVTPVRLFLVLNGMVQQPKTESSILDGTLSFLRLVYYNPDFMNSTEQAQEEEFPSIFDIY